ncbi:MAG: hypothetical protein ABSH40_09940 [Bryobacteraceae bacterium]|jgi:hypothetical protein
MEENKKPPAGFEETDVNVMAVGKFAVALAIMTVLAMLLLVGVFKYFQWQEGGQARSVDPAKVFPQPQLQTTPIPDLKAIRASEEQMLSSYGWVDAQKGVVRIPIARAMDLLVERGLAVRAEAPPSASNVSEPTEAGLGPKMQPPGGPLAGESK